MQITSIGQTPQSALLTTLAPNAIKPNGFIATLPTLQIADHASPNVFALGDIADTGANKAARPGNQQAELVARNIVRLIEGKGEDLDIYKYDTPAIHLSLGIVSVTSRSERRDDAEFRVET